MYLLLMKYMMIKSQCIIKSPSFLALYIDRLLDFGLGFLILPLDFFLFLLGLLLLASDGLEVSGNEQVNHFSPFFVLGELPSED